MISGIHLPRCSLPFTDKGIEGLLFVREWIKGVSYMKIPVCFREFRARSYKQKTMLPRISTIIYYMSWSYQNEKKQVESGIATYMPLSVGFYKTRH